MQSISSSKSSPNHYLNELNHLKEFDLVLQQRLRASSILFQALDNCKDGVIITGPQHDIRYANHSIEKMFGFRLDDLIGQRTQDFFQNDLLKFDVDEKIHNYNDGKVEKSFFVSQFFHLFFLLELFSLECIKI